MPEDQVHFDATLITLRRSSAPYAQHVAVASVDKSVSPFVDPVSLGLYLGVASLVVSLYFGVRSEIRQGAADKSEKTPDFADLLDGLRSGRKSPEQVAEVLRRWKPDLTPIEVAILIRDGARDDLADLLVDLGLPPRTADLMISDMQHRLEQ